MELQLYLDILKRRASVIALIIAIVLSIVAASGFIIHPVYTSSAMVRVLLDVGVAEFMIWEDSGTRILNTYGQILKSGPFLYETLDVLEISSMSAGDLWDRLEVEVLPKTELIMITVKHRDPYLAQSLANTLADLLVDYAQRFYVGSSKSTLQVIEEQLDSMDRQLEDSYERLSVLLAKNAPTSEVEALRSKIAFEEDAYDRLLDRYELARLSESLRANSVTLIAPAELPTEPSNAIGIKEMGLGFFVGAFGGVATALVLENLDTRIHSSRQLEYLTDLPVLGPVPNGLLFSGDAKRSGEVVIDRYIEESYRIISVSLPTFRNAVSAQSVLVTSATGKEISASVAFNLSYVLADRGRDVFILDANLRNPKLVEILGLAGTERESLGLSNLLMSDADLSCENLDPLIRSTKVPGLFLIGAGPKVPKPTLLLASPRMEELLSCLISQEHTVLLAAPPVLGVADVSILAPKLDGVLLVVRQALSRKEHVVEALKQLQSARAKVLGLIFVSKGSKGWSYNYDLG